MNARVKLLRKSLNISQEIFSSKINISRSHFALIESGTKKLTDRVIADICREFHVNEDWLRNGEGLMFKEDDTFSLDDYLNEQNCTEKEKLIVTSFIKAYMKFPVELRDSFIDNMINEFKTINKLPDSKVHDVDFIEAPKDK